VVLEVCIRHEVVFVWCIREDVRAVGRDCSELHRKRVVLALRLHLLVVPDCGTIPTTSVPVAPPAADEAVGQVKPQVLRRTTLHALPLLWVRRDEASVRVLLRQVCGIPAFLDFVLLCPRREVLSLRDTVVLQYRVNDVKHELWQVRVGEKYFHLGRVDEQCVDVDDVRGVVTCVESVGCSDGHLLRLLLFSFVFVVVTLLFGHVEASRTQVQVAVCSLVIRVNK